MDRLNEILFQYIMQNETFDFDDYSGIYKLSDIILNSKVPNFTDKVKNRFGISKSFQLSYEFFNCLDESYGRYFLDRVNSDDLILKYVKVNKETAYSYPDEDGNKKIYLPYSNDICDCFALTHEMFHDMNLQVNNLSITRSLFTEYISMYGEMLLEEFIKNNYDIKCSFCSRYTFNGSYLKALKVDIQLKLVKCFIENGFIDYFKLNEIINNYNPFYRNYLVKYINEIISSEDLSIGYEGRYLIGILLSCYSKDLVLNKKYDIDTFLGINEDINYMYPDEVYNVLDLDVSDQYTMELTSGSYDKLAKSYSKHMR